MNRVCATNDYVQQRLSDSAAGINIYKRIWRKYHPIRNDAGTLVLVFPSRNTLAEQYTSEVIGEYLTVRHRRNYVIIAREPVIPVLSASELCLGEELLSDRQMQLFLRSLQFCPYPMYYNIVSLDLPDGRRGSNLLAFPGMTMEDLVKKGIFSHARVKDNRVALSIASRLLVIHFISYCKKYFSLFLPARSLVRMYETVYLEKGRQIFEELLGKYPDHKMFPAPYAGTGDVYVAAMLLRGYTERWQIKDYFVPVIGKSNVKICSLFGMKAVSLSGNDMQNLMKFLSFIGFAESDCFVLHHDPPGTGIGFMDKMRNVKGLDFYSMYLSGVFATNDRSMAAKPVFNRDAVALDRLFQDHGLVKGKTILLAPYNYTLPNMKISFWERLADLLSEKGYTLCTNSTGDSEKPIRGTVPIFVPYSQIVPFLEAAGSIVAIRSGLCEVISSAACRKIILYLDGFSWNGKDNIDYFSLNRMGLCDDAEEYAYRNNASQLRLAEEIAGTFAPVE